MYYNTAAVIDADGTYLGKYRKQHIPQVKGFWEKFYFKPGNGGYPIFDTAVGKVGVYICYDRHFPEGWRALGLNGAEIVFNPSATHRGSSPSICGRSSSRQRRWPTCTTSVRSTGWASSRWVRTTSTDRATSSGRAASMSATRAVRTILNSSSVNFDLDLIREVRDGWQFYRDRRPEAYGELVEG